MEKDGQLIIMSGFVIAMSMVILTIMLNSIIFTGNTAYEGSLETHENNMLDINRMTIEETKFAIYHYPSDDDFNKYISLYIRRLKELSAYTGASVSLDYSDFDCPSKSGHVTIDYTDPNIHSKYDLSMSF